MKVKSICKNIISVLLVATACMSTVFAVGGNYEKETKSFDINAYLRSPIQQANLYDINIYDTLSMRSGALSEIKTESPDIPADQYIVINNFLSDLFSTKGLSLATIEIHGTGIQNNGKAGVQKVGIGLSLIDISSASGTTPKTASGLQKVDNAGVPVDEKFYTAFNLSFIPDRKEFSSDVSNNSSIVWKETTTDPQPNITAISDHSRNYKLTVKVKEGPENPAGIREWILRGSVYMHMDKSEYDKLEMGKYRTLIKMTITTGV